jgi:hypothetical protein
MSTAGTIDAFGGSSNGVYFGGSLNVGTISSAGTISGTAASGGSGTSMNNVQPTIITNFLLFAGA